MNADFQSAAAAVNVAPLTDLPVWSHVWSVGPNQSSGDLIFDDDDLDQNDLIFVDLQGTNTFVGGGGGDDIIVVLSSAGVLTGALRTRAAGISGGPGDDVIVFLNGPTAWVFVDDFDGDRVAFLVDDPAQVSVEIFASGRNVFHDIRRDADQEFADSLRSSSGNLLEAGVLQAVTSVDLPLELAELYFLRGDALADRPDLPAPSPATAAFAGGDSDDAAAFRGTAPLNVDLGEGADIALIAGTGGGFVNPGYGGGSAPSSVIAPDGTRVSIPGTSPTFDGERDVIVIDAAARGVYELNGFRTGEDVLVLQGFDGLDTLEDLRAVAFQRDGSGEAFELEREFFDGQLELRPAEGLVVRIIENFGLTTAASDIFVSSERLIEVPAGPTEGADRLTGGDGGDVIAAGGGDDVVKSAAGDDEVDLGDGNDVVLAGTGNDTVRGGAGNDTVKSGAGEDSVDGGDGDDVILSGGENDTIAGGAGDDTIKPGRGDDVIDGGDGHDIAPGFRGDETILGGAGSDTLLGNLGDDVIEGGPGDDRLQGGPGRDRFVLSERGFGDDRIVLDFRVGSDTIDFRGSDIEQGDLSFVQTGGNVRIEVAGAEGDSILVSGARTGDIFVADLQTRFDEVFLFDG